MKKSIGAKTIAYPTPVWVVGTYDKNDKPNGITVAWGGICCSGPPCVAISVRPTRHSYQSIIERRAFTVSIPSEAHAKEADYFGIASGAKVDKFSATGLTPVRSDLVDAPYVDQFPLVLECKLLHTFDLGIHTLFIGEILDVKADEAVLAENGLPDIEKVKPISFAPEPCTYHGVGCALGKAFSIGKEV